MLTPKHVPDPETIDIIRERFALKRIDPSIGGGYDNLLTLWLGPLAPTFAPVSYFTGSLIYVDLLIFSSLLCFRLTLMITSYRVMRYIYNGQCLVESAFFLL